MRILFTAGPLRGDLRPRLPLIRAASALGYQVVVATGPDLVGELQRRGYQTWSIGPAAREALFGRPGVARGPPTCWPI